MNQSEDYFLRFSNADMECVLANNNDQMMMMNCHCGQDISEEGRHRGRQLVVNIARVD